MTASASTTEPTSTPRPGTRVAFWVAALLLLILLAELAVQARQQSPTFDESCHIFAGYMSWKGDFGIPPEHPPFIKMWATLPLLRLPLHNPAAPGRLFSGGCAVGGREFLYSNNADQILFRTRIAAAVLA